MIYNIDFIIYYYSYYNKKKYIDYEYVSIKINSIIDFNLMLIELFQSIN